jgi:hypothetical protein
MREMEGVRRSKKERKGGEIGVERERGRGREEKRGREGGREGGR